MPGKEKKKIRDQKSNEVRENKKQSYSQAAAANIAQPQLLNNNLNNINITKDTAATILTCMPHAHTTNIAKPGTYK